MTRLHCIQHVAFEDLGYIETYCRAKGFSMSYTRIFNNDPFPKPSEFDWLVSMGGPMSVYEEREYPWILSEKKCIEDAIAKSKKVIGICLGAQMIASALGARVYPNKTKEIGWFQVSLTPAAYTTNLTKDIPEQFAAFHWHGDTFDIPNGAVHIFRNDTCENQGFIYGNTALGLQFHCESTIRSIQQLIANCSADITPGAHVQSAQWITSNLNTIVEINVTMKKIVDNFEGSGS